MKGLDKAVSALVFPGTCIAWSDKDGALGWAGEAPEGKKKVIYEFEGKFFKPCGDKAHVFHRQFAKVKEVKEEDGGLTVVLEDFTEAVFATVADWTAKVKAAADGAGAAVDAAKEAADKAMGDDEKKPDEAEMGM